jgi:hypothetical protein
VDQGIGRPQAGFERQARRARPIRRPEREGERLGGARVARGIGPQVAYERQVASHLVLVARVGDVGRRVWIARAGRVEAARAPGAEALGHLVGGRVGAVHLQGQIEPSRAGDRVETPDVAPPHRPLRDAGVARKRHGLVDPRSHPLGDLLHLGERDQHHVRVRQPGAQRAQRRNRAEQITEPRPQAYDGDRPRLVIEGPAHAARLARARRPHQQPPTLISRGP